MADIRAFIAIELPAELHQALAEISRKLQTEIPTGVRWVASANQHLTLKFLGESAPARLQLLSRSLPAALRSLPPVTFSVGGLGAFPGPRRPRVLWVGIQAGPELTALQQAVETAAVGVGYTAEDKPFSPHLTLGRAQQHLPPREVEQIAAGLTRVSAGLLGRVSVDNLCLFQSDLKPAGPVYTPLARFKLGNTG
ncbi:MAG TPA: RNA 2',3'-cyclic phosphodiesterase [Anaerolineaceae bacterium]|nr:RNA 2',3'-cyclic phosphodiesterase [Anaerolineaceae bacterium]